MSECKKKMKEIEKVLIHLKGGLEAIKIVPNRSSEDLAAGEAVLEVVDVLIGILKSK